MLSSSDLERLIAVKKRQIESEKTLLGLAPPNDFELQTDPQLVDDSPLIHPSDRHVSFSIGDEDVPEVSDVHSSNSVQYAEDVLKERDEGTQKKELEDDCELPPELERYIRRYLNLPVMLKAGEYSPNNPLFRTTNIGGDIFSGLGEYEQRRDTLRRLKQKEYRDCLEQQSRIKRELQEREDRERCEGDKVDRRRDQRLLEREKKQEQRITDERRHNEVQCVLDNERERVRKIDCATQVGQRWAPLSVGVQTDDFVPYRFSPQNSPRHNKLTRAERELSPRTVQEQNKAACDIDMQEHRKSVEKSPDHKHTYMPSIFDSDIIEERNLKAEQEAAAKKHTYQQDLRNQIMEQQRIKEERLAREKMLEQAEMRRLEQQLQMLRTAQETEMEKNQLITIAMNNNAREFEKKRTSLQKEIEKERKTLFRAASQNTNDYQKNTIYTAQSKSPVNQKSHHPFSINIPENSIFSSSYDVDAYLRKNLNPKKDLMSNSYSSTLSKKSTKKYTFGDYLDLPENNVEKAKNDPGNVRPSYEPSFLRKDISELIKKDTIELRDNEFSQNNLQNDNERNDSKNDSLSKKRDIPKASHSVRKEFKHTTTDTVDETLPIPVLRYSPKINIQDNENNDTSSDAMKKVQDKWKIPAVQKNILKSIPSSDGKQLNILTQLGSIRRQLQLEQMRLDRLNKEN